jgi:hypothetical protein
MRRVLYLVVSSCLLVLLTVTAFAQLEGAPIRANIPFSFEVRGHTLPAGEYEISRVNVDGSGLNITNVDHRHEHAMVETDPVQGTGRNRGELVFHRYGDNYFLYEIWTPGMETGRVLPTSREEKTLRRDLNVAANNVEPQTVAVAIY